MDRFFDRLIAEGMANLRFTRLCRGRGYRGSACFRA
jgi:hypothetical protein